MSQCVRFAQFAQDKRANRLGFLCESLIFLFRTQKTSDSLKKINIFERFYHFLKVFEKSKRFTHSLWAKWANRSGSSGQMSDYVWFAHFAQRDWANEGIACFLANAHSLITRSFFCKKEQFAQKTDDRIPNPAWSNAVHSCKFKMISLYCWALVALCHFPGPSIAVQSCLFFALFCSYKLMPPYFDYSS